MKKANSVLIAILIVLGALLTLFSSILINIATARVSTSGNTILNISIIIFVIASIISSIVVIAQVAHEKRVKNPDNKEVTTETKSIGIRINIDDKHVLIEAPDAESAIEVLQGIHENHLKAELQLKAESEFKFEEKKPEVTDVPETKGGEEENKTT